MRPPKRGTILPNGPEIQRLRELKGWTIEELAARTELSPRNLQRIIKGEATTYKSLHVISDAFDVDYQTLLRLQPRSSEPIDTRAIRADVQPSADRGVELICERTKDGFLLKFQGEIRIQAEEPEKSPQVMAFLQFLKMALPENTEIKLLSVGTAAVVFGVADISVNADAIARMRSYPREEPSRSKLVSKSIPFKNNPLDDPAYWLLAESDRLAYDKDFKIRHDYPRWSTRRGERYPDYRMLGTHVHYLDVKDWLNAVGNADYYPRGMSSYFKDKDEIIRRYPWAFEEDNDAVSKS